MPSPLVLTDFSLRSDGGPFSLELPAGRLLAVVGPSGAGKSALIDCAVGRVTPPRGTARTVGLVVEAKSPGGRRLRPQAIAQRRAGSDRSGLAGEALTATGLWDDRQTSVDRLSPGKQIACELLEPLASKPTLIVIDGHLDHLDAWASSSVMTLLRKRLREGVSVVIVTNRSDIAQDADLLLVLRGLDKRFLGHPSDLLKAATSELKVESVRSETARAIAEPLSLSLKRTGEGMQIQAGQGYELAAKLLLEGYGDVTATFLKSPTFAEALLKL